jgi:long-chain acyl-CoA synthetase
MDWQSAEADYDPDVTAATIPETFVKSAREHGDTVAQQYKGGVYDRSLVAADVIDAPPDGEFGDLTYAEMKRTVRRLSVGLRELGLDPGDRVGIFAHTRMEWAQTDLAVLGAGGVVTTVYTSSSAEQVQYLLSDPDADGVVVENRELLQTVLSVEDELDLSFVILMDGGSHEREDIYTLGEVYRTGEACDPGKGWIVEREREDPASLIYTSGTTGQPKGAVLTHHNFLSNVEQCYRRFGPRLDKSRTNTPTIGPGTTSLSFLPLAHVFERLSGHFLMFAAGATVAYAESPDTLQTDFGLVQPNVAASVPRVYEKLYATIREQASESAVKRRIFEWATDVGRQYHRADEPGTLLELRYRLADRLVFSQVKEALGGNVDFFISGGGSLSAELCELYHGMGIPVLEGYGLTETSPVVTVNPPEEPKVGTIGAPVQDVEIRLDTRIGADEDDSVGELLVRGPNVFDGYWEKPEKTAAAFVSEAELDGGRDRRPSGGNGTTANGGADAATDGKGDAATDGEDDAAADSETVTDRDTAADGGAAADAESASTQWFRTGDVVKLRDDGYVEFRERAKQLLKLSTGKMVPPGPIEDAFAASTVVEQAIVLGDARKFVGALLVPDFDAIRSWADSEGIELPDSDRLICREDAVVERVQREVDAVNEGFEKHEQIKQFRLVPEAFTEENDLLTPTMKKKRRKIEDYYEAEIERLYDDR